MRYAVLAMLVLGTGCVRMKAPVCVPAKASKIPVDEATLNGFGALWNNYLNSLREGVFDMRSWEHADEKYMQMTGRK